MRLISGILAAASVIALSACGSTTASAPAGSGGGGIPIQVDAANFQFSPSTISVKPGDRVTVTLTNKDSFEHNFSISELGVSRDVEGKGTGSVTFTATSSNLEFFCKYHRATGMVGSLSVGATNAIPSEPAAAPSPSGTYSKYPSY